MKQPKQMVKETGCGDCPAYRGFEVSNTRVQNLTAIPSQMVAQTTDGAWHAMLTAVGKGKFLIRRRKHPTANTCPLLNYDVRRIDADGSSGHQRDKIAAGDPTDNPKARGACRDLLMLVLMGQI